MLTLYNADISVCSVKVRIGLAEKQIEWKDEMLSLPKGEQLEPEYLKLNPKGVVPTLVDGDLVVTESSIILEYIDELGSENKLMPSDAAENIATKIWLLRCLEIHSAINTMYFSTVNRDKILAKQSPQTIAANIAKMPDPRAAAKRRDVLDNGIHSSHVAAAFFIIKKMLDDMQASLEKTKWLTGDEFSMSDVALIAYVDRLDRMHMSGLWSSHNRVEEWLTACKDRPSYARAIDRYSVDGDAEVMRESGVGHWPNVKKLWDEFLLQS